MRRRLDSLTGLRFFAALAVVLVHAAYLVGGGPWSRGSIGVSFFFVLSGFVLTWNYPDGARPGGFYWRRFARIYPVYALTWAAGIAVSHHLGQHTSVAGALAGLTLTQAWFPWPSIVGAGNNVAWSLSCEAFFYLCFPLLILGLRRVTPRVRVAIVVPLAVASSAIIIVWGTTYAHAVRFEATYSLPILRLPEFLLGIVVALAIREGWRPRVTLAAAALTAGVALSLLSPAASSSVTGYTILPFALLVGAVAARDLGRPTRLAWRPLVKLGEWSYALYLVHALVYRLAVGHLPASWLGVAVVIVVSVVISGALYEWFERPVERRLRLHVLTADRGVTDLAGGGRVPELVDTSR